MSRQSLKQRDACGPMAHGPGPAQPGPIEEFDAVISLQPQVLRAGSDPLANVLSKLFVGSRRDKHQSAAHAPTARAGLKVAVWAATRSA